MKKILEDFKKDIDSNTNTVGDLNTPLSKMGRSSKQNIKKDVVALNKFGFRIGVLRSSPFILV